MHRKLNRQIGLMHSCPGCVSAFRGFFLRLVDRVTQRNTYTTNDGGIKRG